MSSFKKRKFLTESLEGYIGKNQVCITRSSWETKVVNLLQHLVKAKKIKGWNSEEAVFEYEKTIDNKRIHRYFMDFMLVKNDDSVVFIEVKPFKETFPSYNPNSKKPLTEKQKIAFQSSMSTYLTNDDKWSAVTKWCDNKNLNSKINFSFQIWTEKMERPAEMRYYSMNKSRCNYPVYPVITIKR